MILLKFIRNFVFVKSNHKIFCEVYTKYLIVTLIRSVHKIVKCQIQTARIKLRNVRLKAELSTNVVMYRM